MLVFLEGLLAIITKVFANLGWSGSVALVDFVYQVTTSEFKKEVSELIAAQILKYGGLEIAPDDIWSEAGWAKAIGDKLGFPLRSLHDRVLIEEDVSAGAAAVLAERIGLTVTLPITTDGLKKDVMAYGVQRVALDAGIFLSDPTDIEAIKRDVKTWGMQEAMIQVSEDLAAQVNLATSDGVRLVQLMAARVGPDVKPKDILNNARATLLSYAGNEIKRAEVFTKKDRRRLANREAQRKFRARHGKGGSAYDGSGISRYVPVGWRADISEPPKAE
jgi:hypothetical protein